MARKPLALAVALAVALCVPASAPAAPLDALVQSDLNFAASQLNRTLAEVPSGSYPHMIQSDGRWLNRAAGWWISGFFPGSLWQMYEATGDAAWRTAAAARQAGIESQKTNRNTHDLGFMIFDSFGHGYRLTGTDSYRQVVLTAASSLATRYSPIVRATRSWNNTSADAASDFKVIVDNMMNLELLFWAAANGGDAAHATKAREHALRTMAEHVRPDGSTHHLVVFDSNTGAVKRKQTVQGYSNTSTWSRGQAWAIYGFTMAYRELRDARMLDTARRVADWYLSHLPADKVPYWDFQAPGIPNEPRDSSAAAIAASGLIELARLDNDPVRGQRYLDAAKATLTTLSGPGYLAKGTTSRSILLHGTSNKPTGEYDRGLIYGDYYFLEALLRYRAVARGPSPPADFNGDGYADAAIGAPGEDAGAGAVNVLYGGPSGLTTTGARQIAQAAAGGATEAGDRFGTAVAAGDFNRDGYSDLAVGAPGEDSGAGAVNVLQGSASGLVSTNAKQFLQGTAGGATEAGDAYGSALAAADFNGDGRFDLAGGAPAEDTSAEGADVGEVNVLYGSASGLTSTGAIEYRQAEAGGAREVGDRFGSALAAGSFDGDMRADLAVGAPGEDTTAGADAGAVNVMNGSASGVTPTGARELTQTSAAGAAEAGDRFGSALATGDFDGDGRSDLAAGAPNDDAGSVADAGLVNVVPGGAGGLATGRAKELAQSAAAEVSEAGDRFGSALSAADYNGDGRYDLAVGAPDEDLAAGVDAGVVGVLNGDVAGPGAGGAKLVTQGSTGGGTTEPSDRFGTALASANFNGDGRLDLISGAPGEDGSAGVVNVSYGSAAGLTGTAAQQLGQGSAGGVAEANDRFGSALR